MKRLWMGVPVLIIGVAIAVVILPDEPEPPPPLPVEAPPVVIQPKEVFAPFGKEHLVEFTLGRIKGGTAEFSFPPDTNTLFLFALTGWKGPIPSSGKLKLEVSLYDANRKRVSSAVSPAVPHSGMPIFGTLTFTGVTREKIGRIAYYSTRILFTKKQP